MNELDKARMQEHFPNVYFGDVIDCICGWIGEMELMIVVYTSGSEQPDHLHCPRCGVDHDIEGSSTHY